MLVKCRVSFSEVSAADVPDWIFIYFMKTSANEYKCNICECVVKDESTDKLLNHIKEAHQEVHELHKDSTETSVGFQIEFLQFSMLKDDKQPLLLEEVCETAELEKNVKEEKKDFDNMEYLQMPTKKNVKKSCEFSRKRSWVWKYFESLTSIIYRCTLCNVVLSIKGCNTNNMNRHVRTRHPNIYKAEVEKKKDLCDNEQYDISWKTEENDKEGYESSDIMKQRRSWIWSYFKRISNTIARCNLCNRNINHGGNATGNMNRHLKMIHNKTADNWVWKVFDNTGDNFFMCKICQYKCIKFDDEEKSVKHILLHLKEEHGVVSGDQIITGTDLEAENT